MEKYVRSNIQNVYILDAKKRVFVDYINYPYLTRVTGGRIILEKEYLIVHIAELINELGE